MEGQVKSSGKTLKRLIFELRPNYELFELRKFELRITRAISDQLFGYQRSNLILKGVIIKADSKEKKEFCTIGSCRTKLQDQY